MFRKYMVLILLVSLFCGGSALQAAVSLKGVFFEDDSGMSLSFRDDQGRECARQRIVYSALRTKPLLSSRVLDVQSLPTLNVLPLEGQPPSASVLMFNDEDKSIRAEYRNGHLRCLWLNDQRGNNELLFNNAGIEYLSFIVSGDVLEWFSYPNRTHVICTEPGRLFVIEPLVIISGTGETPPRTTLFVRDHEIYSRTEHGAEVLYHHLQGVHWEPLATGDDTSFLQGQDVRVIPLFTDEDARGYTALLVDIEKKTESLLAVPYGDNYFQAWTPGAFVTRNPLPLDAVGGQQPVSPVFQPAVKLTIVPTPNGQFVLGSDDNGIRSIQRDVLCALFPASIELMSDYFTGPDAQYLVPRPLPSDFRDSLSNLVFSQIMTDVFRGAAYTVVPGSRVHIGVTGDYVLKKWSGDIAAAADPVSFIVTRSMTVSADLQPYYRVQKETPLYGGYTYVSPDVLSVAPGTRIVCTAVPTPGHMFGWWVSPAPSLEARLSIMPQSDIWLRARYVRIEPSGAGVVRITADAALPGHLILDAVPTEGYVFKSWRVERQGLLYDDPVPVSMDITIPPYALFIKDWDTVAAIPGQGPAALAAGTRGVFAISNRRGMLWAGHYSGTDMQQESESAVGPVPEPFDRRMLSLVLVRDVPYLAFIDRSRGNAPVVMTYTDAHTWSELAGGPLSAQAAVYVSLAVSSRGVLYAAYVSEVSGKTQLVVKRYDNGTWTQLGTAMQFTYKQIAAHFSLCIDEDTPYIAFRDPALRDGPTVKKFNGASWEFVGPQRALPKGRACEVLLKVIDHVPYLIYRYDAWKVVVARYMNGRWSYHEPNGIDTSFSDIDDRYPLEFFVHKGDMYVVFYDMPGGQGRYVLCRYDGARWDHAGVDVMVWNAAPYPFQLFDGVLYTITEDQHKDGLLLRRNTLSN